MQGTFQEEARSCNNRLDLRDLPPRSAEDALSTMVSDCWSSRREEPHRCLLLAERAMPIAQDLRDVYAQATLVLASANARTMWRQFSEAIELCQEAHYLALALGADKLEGWRLAIWSEIQQAIGNQEVSDTSLDQARCAFRAANDQTALAELDAIFSQRISGQKQAI